MPQFIEKLIRYSRVADGSFAVISAVTAAIYAMSQSWLAASLWLAGALLSGACYFWPPAKWLVRRQFATRNFKTD